MCSSSSSGDYNRVATGLEPGTRLGSHEILGLLGAGGALPSRAQAGRTWQKLGGIPTGMVVVLNWFDVRRRVRVK